jgi:hypothetical protein
MYHEARSLRIYLTVNMDSRPVVWGATNLRHIQGDHRERGISRDDVIEGLNDPQRVESAEERGTVTYHTVIGATRNGRPLVVVWIGHLAGRFPVHARQVGRRAARRYYR